jgi:hypothetical protein
MQGFAGIRSVSSRGQHLSATLVLAAMMLLQLLMCLPLLLAAA